MKPINGYTSHSGSFDFSKDGSLALELTLQGRIVEVNATGEPVFEYISYRDEKSVYWQRGAQYLTQDAYNEIINAKCGEK